jgi:RNA polymerase sigma factor (sigma-70 family)
VRFAAQVRNNPADPTRENNLADLTFCAVPSSRRVMRMKRPFEEIVAQHGPTVLRVCRAVLARPDADDAWSETFLAALRAYPDLADGANIEAWLVTIAHHKAIDALRAQSRRAVPVADIAETSSNARAWEPPEDNLWAALRALPTKQRQAVAYHHLAGLPYAEVATIIGGSTDAARRAAYDGVRTLRRRYRDPQQLTSREGIHS